MVKNQSVGLFAVCMVGWLTLGAGAVSGQDSSWFGEPADLQILTKGTGCQSCLPNPDENGGQTCSIDNCSPWVTFDTYKQHDFHPIMCDWFTLGTEHCITPMEKKRRECDATWDCGSDICECMGRGLFIEAFPIDPPGRQCHNHCEGLNGLILVGTGQALHGQTWQWNCVHANAPCDLKEAQKNAVDQKFPSPTSGSCWSCWDRDSCGHDVHCPDESHTQGDGH